MNSELPRRSGKRNLSSQWFLPKLYPGSWVYSGQIGRISSNESLFGVISCTKHDDEAVKGYFAGQPTPQLGTIVCCFALGGCNCLLITFQ